MSERYFRPPGVPECAVRIPLENKSTPESNKYDKTIPMTEWEDRIKKDKKFIFKGFIEAEKEGPNKPANFYVETVALNEIGETENDHGAHVGAEAIGGRFEFINSPEEVNNYRMFLEFPKTWLKDEGLIAINGELMTIEKAEDNFEKEAKTAMKEAKIKLNFLTGLNPEKDKEFFQKIQIACEALKEYIKNKGRVEYAQAFLRGVIEELKEADSPLEISDIEDKYVPEKRNQ